jgi:16S rRNA (cytidine1402-2'-O)-methyltransferase
MREHAPENKLNGLFVVATPIGNLEDVSFRALRVLKECDWVAAEDTRESRKLLDHYGISARLYSLHEHSSPEKVEELVSLLKSGQAGAYVSDAGTPGLCDPGADLVAACAAGGVPVCPVPGPSALTALLSVCAFKEPNFSFHGFFPREKKEREEWAKGARGVGGAHLFYESPHRVQGALEFLSQFFPGCPLVVGRELTKRFETITRGTCQSVAGELGSQEPRGEYALALLLPRSEEASAGLLPAEISALVKELALLGASQKVLVRAGTSHGLRKNEAYKLALEAIQAAEVEK